VQTARKSVAICCEFLDLLSRRLDVPKAFQVYRQQTQALDVLVKLAGNPVAFILMRLNQLATHPGKKLRSLVRFLDLSKISYICDQTENASLTIYFS
jgi:hypothetical protein